MSDPQSPQSPQSTIPQSTALQEASPLSINELFARDPEGYQAQDLERLIQVYREQRKRFEEAEKAGIKPGKPKKAVDLGTKVGTQAPVDADELF